MDGEKLLDPREAFFEELADAMDYWVKTMVEALTNENVSLYWVNHPEAFKRLAQTMRAHGCGKSDLEQIFSQCLRSYTVSFLTIIDGGTRLAETTQIYLTNDDGKSLGEDLHQSFVGYLLDTKRLNLG